MLEVGAAILTCAYLWEICDALGTEHWRRRITPTTPLSMPDSELPMVSLHLPAHNQPPDMVIDTLRSLLRLDYPRYEVILIDDNTDDESLWRPVEAWCERHGVKFAHLEDWPGYKSGALNYALRQLTSPDAEIIRVVDSDYQLEPGFLRRCAPRSPIRGSASSRRRRTTGTGSRRGTTGGCTTPTATSSPSRNLLEPSTTELSSPAPWA
jgi:glycosyltransferase involved in cell wall biosynthesis